MEIINLSEQDTVVSSYLAELRDIDYQRSAPLFRANVRRIGQMMAYEVSKTFHYVPQDIRTPLGTAHMRLPDERIVVATVLRAGLPMQQGFLDVFDHADSAFVSAYREYINEARTEVGIHVEYLAAPDLEGSRLIIADPMLATGGSMDLAYQAYLTNGTPAKLDIACIIATPEGLNRLQRALPENTTIWCAAIDERLNKRKYIVPGLGDAGDLCFGEKI